MSPQTKANAFITYNVSVYTNTVDIESETAVPYTLSQIHACQLFSSSDPQSVYNYFCSCTQKFEHFTPVNEGEHMNIL